MRYSGVNAPDSGKSGIVSRPGPSCEKLCRYRAETFGASGKASLSIDIRLQLAVMVLCMTIS
jgi:hypothetical protein